MKPTDPDYNPLIHHGYISKYLNWLLWIATLFAGYLVGVGFAQAGAPPEYEAPRSWSPAYVINVLQIVFLFGTVQVFLLNLTSSNRVLRLYKTIYFPLVYFLCIPVWAGLETIPTILGTSNQYSGAAIFVIVVYALGCVGIVVYHLVDYYLRATLKYDFLGFFLSRLCAVLTVVVIGAIVSTSGSESSIVSFGPVIIGFLVSLFCYNLRHPASIVCLAVSASLFTQSLAWEPALQDGSFALFLVPRTQVCWAAPAIPGSTRVPGMGKVSGLLCNITSDDPERLFSAHFTFVQSDLQTPELTLPSDLILDYTVKDESVPEIDNEKPLVTMGFY